MKRALEDGPVVTTETGEQGKPVIHISVEGGALTIYESLVTPGTLILEVDDVDYLNTADPDHQTFPGIDRLPAIPGLHVYHNDAPVRVVREEQA